jgi:hypothetical protein
VAYPSPEFDLDQQTGGGHRFPSKIRRWRSVPNLLRFRRGRARIGSRSGESTTPSVLAHRSDILAQAGHSSTSRPLRRRSIPTWPRVDLGRQVPFRRGAGFQAVGRARARRGAAGGVVRRSASIVLRVGKREHSTASGERAGHV